MSQVVLHLGEQYVQEDLEYYFSPERDKNNQVRPNEKIYSMTPHSRHIEIDFSDGKVGNFFYPVLPDGLDRIYIGISISLFANHWGASFLLELLKHLNPGGAVILPVYPEGQAAEKNYWSRSFLENIFLSRQRWTGFSNISAENDGVMSLRVGRKWPPPLPSSIEWFFRQRSNLLLADLPAAQMGSDGAAYLKAAFVPLCNMIWNEYADSAVIEKIIIDCLGKNTRCCLFHVGADYGLLANDLILSAFLQVTEAETWHAGECRPILLRSIRQYFRAHTGDAHRLHVGNTGDVVCSKAFNVAVISRLFTSHDEADYCQLLEKTWACLPVSGLLIVREDLTDKAGAAARLEALTGALAEVSYYSSIAACRIQPNVEISQYSLAVEENLRQEAHSKNNLFRVLQKVSQGSFSTKPDN